MREKSPHRADLNHEQAIHPKMKKRRTVEIQIRKKIATEWYKFRYRITFIAFTYQAAQARDGVMCNNNHVRCERDER